MKFEISGLKSGQAMVEFIVALVCILVLVAGIIQISVLGLRHSTLMNEARREAGQKAMLDVSSYSGPLFVSACTEGPDGIAYSRDDEKTIGNVADLTVGIADHSTPGVLDGFCPANPVSTIAGSSLPHLLFGLVEGEKKDSVTLIPVVREMIYRKSAVDLKVSAWMTWTKGVY